MRHLFVTFELQPPAFGTRGFSFSALEFKISGSTIASRNRISFIEIHRHESQSIKRCRKLRLNGAKTKKQEDGGGEQQRYHGQQHLRGAFSGSVVSTIAIGPKNPSNDDNDEAWRNLECRNWEVPRTEGSEELRSGDKYP